MESFHKKKLKKAYIKNKHKVFVYRNILYFTIAHFCKDADFQNAKTLKIY